MADSKKQILITGCGSSGTKYIATVLQAAGLQIGHERISPDGMACWYAAPGYDVKANAPFNAHVLPDYEEFPVILHQVRYPLGTISSAAATWSENSWKYIAEHVNLSRATIRSSREKAQIHAAMIYWIEWSKMAERISKMTYRVEDLFDIWNLFCHMIERPEISGKKDTCQNVPQHINSRKDRYKKLSWRDLKQVDAGLTEDIQALAFKYGYDVE